MAVDKRGCPVPKDAAVVAMYRLALWDAGDAGERSVEQRGVGGEAGSVVDEKKKRGQGKKAKEEAGGSHT